EDGQRRTRVRECFDDAGHQRVPSFRALVRIGVRAEGDGVLAPAGLGDLFRENLRDVDFHDDLVVEVVAGVEVEVGMCRTGEAVCTSMTASAVRVDRPAERHLRLPRYFVER